MRALAVLGLLAVAPLLVPPAAAGPGDRHVDPVAGSDLTGTGSATQPWRTLTHAVARFRIHDGIDTIWLAAGRYDATSGESFPIVLPDDAPAVRGDPRGGTVLLTGGDSGLVFTPTGSRFTGQVEDLTLDGSRSGAAGDGTGLTDPLLVRHCVVTGFRAGLSTTVAWGPGGYGAVAFSGALESSTLVGNQIGVVLDLASHSPIDEVSAGFAITNAVIARNGLGVLVQTGCAGCLRFVLDVRLTGSTVAANGGHGIQLRPLPGTTPFEGAVAIDSSVLAFNAGFGLVLGTVPASHADNLFFGNGAGEISGGALGAGDAVADPLFRDLAAGDYHLSAGSAGIDSAGPGALADDRSGTPRPIDGDGDSIDASDRGAFERAGGDLRRGDLAEIDPPLPALASVLPFALSNPATPVVVRDFASADLDPTPGILTRPSVPLAFYQLDPEIAGSLHAVKDAAAGSLVFFLRR